MEPRRFDSLARALAAGKTRRGILGGLAAFVVGVHSASAQSSCPPGQIRNRKGDCNCPAGTDPCPDGCFNRRSDPSNCGRCGNVCLTGEVCQKGACRCPNGVTCGATCTTCLNPVPCGSEGEGFGCNSPLCFTTTEGNNTCSDADVVSEIIPCTSSDQCPSGYICAVGTCAAGSICLRVCGLI